MIKVAVIVLLLIIGGLAAKRLDERTQLRALMVFGGLVVIAVIVFMAMELMR
ncbi:hypothetical protein [Photobacterium aquae]|uniref:hypothetical protein n=1 Tax=Photobacterium aquae TaxID=1195763 RepID=UPI000A79DA15|nr:hypothetical protein [Photobacterium aquae]